MRPLDVHPDSDFDRPLEGGEIRQTHLSLKRSGQWRAHEFFVAIRFRRDEVDGEEFESHSTTLLVERVLAPLLKTRIVDSPGLDHASSETGPSIDHAADPIRQQRWHSSLAGRLAGSVERLIVLTGLEFEPIGPLRGASNAQPRQEEGGQEGWEEGAEVEGGRGS
jgi:hypothetical protein